MKKGNFFFFFTQEGKGSLLPIQIYQAPKEMLCI